MESLDQQYIDRLDAIKNEIADSEELANYLESEEGDDYLELRREFEPRIHDLYQEVAINVPMQLIDLELRLTDEGFEGLYLPRILGYTILRGQVNADYKFIRPQEQFSTILRVISESNNFEVLSKRIGQTVQIGFALSSDIWITNFIKSLPSKRVRDFLTSQKLPKYLELDNRKLGLAKYKKQFEDFVYFTAEFPERESDLSIFYPELKSFLVSRIWMDKPIDNLSPYISRFAAVESMWGHWQFVYLLGLMANYFPLNEEAKNAVRKTLNKARTEQPKFTSTYFEFLKELLLSEIPVDSDCNDRISSLLDKSIQDDFTKYYSLMDILHIKGWIHDDSVVAVREFYEQHEGTSTINECVRLTIYKFFSKIVRNLESSDYPTVIELFKDMMKYFTIFNNQHFAQSTKKRTLWFVKKFNKVYTDKRGKEYQEMKKFISSQFTELNLMTTKEVTEFFKTKRVRKAAAS